MTSPISPAASPSTVVEASSLESAGTTRPAPLGRIRPHLLERIGGIAFIAAPLLHAGGMLTSPPQTDEGTAGYIASLAADPALSILSANLLHYGWVAFAIAAVAGRGLLRGKPGSVWLPIAAVALLIGSIQMSGLLLSDWFLVSAGTVLPIDQAVLLDETAKDASVGIWLVTGQVLGLAGLLAYSLGLGRARAVSWWIAPLGGLAWLAPMFVGGPIGAALMLVLFAPFVVAGVRLVAAR